MSLKILLLPGDGIGPEIMSQAVKILKKIEEIQGKRIFEFEYADIGGVAIDNHKNPFPDATSKLSEESDAILLACVGGYKWDSLPMEQKPETGLLAIRKKLDLFANIRPVKIFSELINASTLKAEIIENLDIIIIRELTSGLYFGEPKGIGIKDGEEYGFNTMGYKKSEIERIATVGFEIAEKRSKKLCSVDKANVLICMKMWRETVNEISKKYSNIELSHSYVDAMAMELIKRPKNYDVILTENTFGDILSDLASQLVGSIGLLPSASLGNLNKATNKRFSLYEPIHGSAPDIAGKNIANPIGMIMSVAMMLEYSLNMQKEANMITESIKKSLKIIRTSDLKENGYKTVGTDEFGDFIVKQISEL